MNLRALLNSVFLFVIMYTSINAQRLPNVQKVSVRVSDNIKTDDKSNEWNNKFEAYNHATQVYYTMANDNDNLYLAIQARDMDAINRVVGNGVTFAIIKPDKSTISITYPFFEGKGIFFSLGRKGDIQDTSLRVRDSVMASDNQKIDRNCKWIKVTGIKDIDTVISVYNDNGIKVRSFFDNRKHYTIEFAITLKNLSISIPPVSDVDKLQFRYHIIVNGAIENQYKVSPQTGGSQSNADKIAGYFRQFNADNSRASAPTDFWGEYKLAKKP